MRSKKYFNKFVENFYCPSGYTKESKGVCKREVKVGWHKTDYYCPNGYTLSGTKCVSSNVTGKKIYMCSNGAQLFGNVCQTFPISRCPYGYTVKAEYFADCSGDSILAPLSNAEYRYGRESGKEFKITLPQKRQSVIFEYKIK